MYKRSLGTISMRDLYTRSLHKGLCFGDQPTATESAPHHSEPTWSFSPFNNAVPDVPWTYHAKPWLCCVPIPIGSVCMSYVVSHLPSIYPKC